jgi:hypothetical protein
MDEKNRITFRIDPKLHSDFIIKCKIDGKSMTEVLIGMIESYMDPNSPINKVIEVRSALKHNYDKLSKITPH